MPLPPETARDSVGLPARPFLYSIEQISGLTAVPVKQLQKVFIHYDGKTLGAHKKSQLMARNISPPGFKPVWRVAESELIRWLRAHRFRVYEKAYTRD